MISKGKKKGGKTNTKDKDKNKNKKAINHLFFKLKIKYNLFFKKKIIIWFQIQYLD